MERILELNRQLAELEVKPNMHAGSRPVELIDPVKRAEWISGQLRNLLQEGYGFGGNANALLEEHDLMTGGEDGIKIIDSNSASEAPSYARLLLGLGLLAEKLGATADETDKDI
jgi:hypothetical protein